MNAESKASSVRDYDTETTKTTDGSVMFSVSDVKANWFENSSYTVTDTSKEPETTITYYRPTASFTNSESEFAYNSSQAWAENQIKRS